MIPDTNTRLVGLPASRHGVLPDREAVPLPRLDWRSPGELVAPAALAVRAAEVAARQRSPETRRTYAAVYRAFCAFLGLDATPADLTPEAVRATATRSSSTPAARRDRRQAPLRAARAGRRRRRRPPHEERAVGQISPSGSL